MKTTYKIIGAVAIVALFACMSLTPIFTSTVTDGSSREIYNQELDDYILGIEYNPETCIYSTAGTAVQNKVEWKDNQDGTTTTTKYTKREVQNDGSKVLQNLSSESMKVYPGAILRADQDLANGTANPINLPRTEVTLSTTLPKAASRTVTPEYSTVKNAVGSMIDEWGKAGIPASVTFDDVSTTAHTREQISIELGVDLDLLDGIGIGVNWKESSDKQTVVFSYTGVYYSVNSSYYNHPAAYFRPDVSVSDAKLVFQDDPTVFVDTATYGTMVLFSATSTDTSTDIGLALSLAIQGYYVDLKPEQQQALQNTSFSLQVIGGTQQSGTITYNKGDLSSFLAALQNLIATKTVGVDDYLNAALLSAETSFLDTHKTAYTYISTEYVEKETVLTTSIDVEYNMTGGYCGTFKVWYKTYESIDENGNYIGVKDQELKWSWATAKTDAHKTIPAKHLNEFSIYARAEAGQVVFDHSDIPTPLTSIYLYQSGTTTDVTYELYVDDELYKQKQKK